MIVKLHAESQQSGDTDVLVPGGSLMEGEEDRMSTCLTSFKSHEIQNQVDSPPFLVIFRYLLHFRQEQCIFMSFWSKKSIFVKFNSVVGAKQESLPHFTKAEPFLSMLYADLEAIRVIISTLDWRCLLRKFNELWIFGAQSSCSIVFQPSQLEWDRSTIAK